MLRKTIIAIDYLGYLKSDDKQYYHGISDWLKSLKDRVGNFDDGYKVGFSAAKYNQWKPSDEQMQALSDAGNSFRPFEEGHKVLWSLYNDLKKLKGEE